MMGEAKEMTAKEFLGQYRAIIRKIRIIEQDIERLETKAQGGAIAPDGQPHGTPSKDHMGDKAAAAADKQQELDWWISELTERKWEILRVIMQIEDAEQVAVLQLRYLQERPATWDEIGERLGRTGGVSWRQAQRIHGAALEAVSEKITAAAS